MIDPFHEFYIYHYTICQNVSKPANPEFLVRKKLLQEFQAAVNEDVWSAVFNFTIDPYFTINMPKLQTRVCFRPTNSKYKSTHF